MTNLPKDADGDVRDMFEGAVEAYERGATFLQADFANVSVSDVCGMLWNCTDVLPRSLRPWVTDALDDGAGEPITYAQAVRRLKAVLAKLPHKL